MSPLPGLKSIEDVSISRKFSLVFTLISFLPFIILAALFYIFFKTGGLKIDPDLFFWAVFLTGAFSIIGFFIMRGTFSKLSRLLSTAKNIFSGNLTQTAVIKKGSDNEVAQLARLFNEVVQKLEDNIKELEKSKKMIQDVLVKVASGTSITKNVDAFLDLILSVTTDALDGKIGAMFMLEESGKELVVQSIYGVHPPYEKNTRIALNEEMAGWVIRQKKPLLVSRLHKITAAEETSLVLAPPLICAPLVIKDKILGVICVSDKKKDADFTEDELVILAHISSQVALAIENARLNNDNQKAYLETISALAMAVEARDIYSRGHSDRVRDYAVRTAVKMGLSEQQVKIIREAAQLHDVGKIGIRDDILNKPDHLDDSERRIMCQHPVIGEGIIIPLHGMAHLRDALRHHHEWVDGTGYPDHLKSGDISLEAKILAVADSFDAMTTDRPYRKKMDFNQAKDELIKFKDRHFDSAVVDAFISWL